jgi:putative ABC transport system substrate-binding protein
MLGRRTFTASMAIAATVSAVASLGMIESAWAQQRAKLPKVAILLPRAPATPTCEPDLQAGALPCFTEAMRDLGYVDGKNVSFDVRFGEEDYVKLPALATELVSHRPEVVYTAGPAAIAAASATTTIPIIVGPGDEETLTRLAGNFAHPTGNVTGFTLASVEQELKCLEFLKELAPRASRVAVLLNPDSPRMRDYPGILSPAAARMGLTLIRIEARSRSDLPRAFAAIAASGANAIYVLADPLLTGTSPGRKQLSELALKQGLPVVSPNAQVASDGGLLSFGTDLNVLVRRAATYIDKVLKGVKVADLPVERPTVFKLSVNVQTAKALGIVIPQSLMLRADAVIQ